MDDIRIIIELSSVIFIIWFLFYISGLSISDFINITGNILTLIIQGFISVIISVIGTIFGVIATALSNLVASIHIL